MRQFVVSEAPVARVAQHVREVVEEAGGIVAHHTAHRTEFDHLDYGDEAWRRAGYVGTYQRFKEKPAQVRIRVWAQWPRRMLIGSVYMGLAVALAFFVISLVEVALPPNLWIGTSLPILLAIAGSFLMYTSSMADSQAAEARIEELLVERIRADEQIDGEVFTIDDWEAHRDELVTQAREDARRRSGLAGSRFQRALGNIGEAVPLGDDEEESAPQQDAETVEAQAQQAEDPSEEEPLEEAPTDQPESSEEPDDDEEGRLGSTWSRVKSAIGLGDEPDAEAEEDDEAPDEEPSPGEPEEGSGPAAVEGSGPTR